MVVSNGPPSIIRGFETCFPRLEYQRFLAHRMRNLAAKVPEELWPEFNSRVVVAYKVPSCAITQDLAQGVIADFEAELPTP